MVETKVLDLENNEKGKIKLPSQFEEDLRPDLIKRAVHAIMSHDRQRYGADPRAGLRASAKISKSFRPGLMAFFTCSMAAS